MGVFKSQMEDVMEDRLKPCPFCGGDVQIEKTIDGREWFGVVCRNTKNLGGTCAISQRPSASKKAAIKRWNTRATGHPDTIVPTMNKVESVCMTFRHDFNMLSQKEKDGLRIDAQHWLQCWVNELNKCAADPLIDEIAEKVAAHYGKDMLLEKMEEAYQAACTFIDSHGCGPDITSEIGKNYVTFFRKRKALQEYQEMKDAK